MLHLAREMGSQHEPACVFRFVSREVCLRGVVGIEGRLQAQNFCSVRRGCFEGFMQLSGEGFELALARSELCDL
jgi:hypothetical protein